jgi:hypothetical protein
MARRSRTPDAPAAVLDLPVTYGNVSIGDKTARVGIVIDRSQITVTRADKSMVGKRLIGRILANPPEERNPDQGRLDGMDAEIVTLAGAFDVKALGVTAKTISCGLTFALASIEVDQLAHFAKRIGRLVVDAVEALDEDEGGDHADE